MRKGMINQMFAAALCACALSTMAWAQGDVNIPWDPAEHFEPYWESVSLSSQLYNPIERPDSDPNVQRQLSIGGGVRMLDKTGLVGVESRQTDVVVLDQDGAEIYSTAGQPSGIRWYRSPGPSPTARAIRATKVATRRLPD